jgi:hypothetical protein
MNKTWYFRYDAGLDFLFIINKIILIEKKI